MPLNKEINQSVQLRKTLKSVSLDVNVIYFLASIEFNKHTFLFMGSRSCHYFSVDSIAKRKIIPYIYFHYILKIFLKNVISLNPRLGKSFRHSLGENQISIIQQSGSVLYFPIFQSLPIIEVTVDVRPIRRNTARISWLRQANWSIWPRLPRVWQR